MHRPHVLLVLLLLLLLLFLLPQFRHQYESHQAELQSAKAEIEQYRVDLAERVDRLAVEQRSLAEERDRRQATEKALESAKEQLAGQEGQRSAKELQAEVESLKSEKVLLHQQVHKYQQLADIASEQQQRCEMTVDIHKDELATLREQKRELAAAGNDEAIIGKLQQRLLSMKASYQACARKVRMTGRAGFAAEHGSALTTGPAFADGPCTSNNAPVPRGSAEGARNVRSAGRGRHCAASRRKR